MDSRRGSDDTDVMKKVTTDVLEMAYEAGGPDIFRRARHRMKWRATRFRI